MLIINELIPLRFSSIRHQKLDDNMNSILGSDTLFSALCNVSLIAGKRNIIEALCKGEIIISSLFPAFKSKLFLPKPILFYETNLAQRKIFKKIRFFEVEDFAEINNHLEINHLKGLKVKNTFYPKNSQISISKYDSPQVVIDILQNGSMPFWEDYIVLENDKSVYFLAEVKENLIKDWQVVVRLLAHEGIGGNRTIGHGIFKEAKFYSAEIKENRKDFFVNLSLTVPKNGERDLLITYSLAKRGGGFVYQLGGREIPKPFIFTVAEGSVFKKRIQGKIIPLNLSLKEPVYYNGFCFNIPLGSKLCRKEEL